MKTQLPSRPNLERLKKQAKAILKGHQASDPEILKRIGESHPRFRNPSQAALRNAKFTLADAQLVIANESGFQTWAKLKAHVLNLEAPQPIQAIVDSLRDAAGRGDLARVNSLLDERPELINEPGGSGVRTALHQAVFGAQEAAARLLLERGADPNIRCEGDNAYPLHFAAEKQNFSMIRLLIEHGGDPVGEGDYHELGVLGWATAWEYVNANPEIVNYLLAHGARHNISSAVAVGEVDIIRELIARSPGDLEKRMDMANRRRRPLHLAVVKKQPAALKALLDLGANTESLDEAGFSALDQAALIGETELARILLDRGAKVRLPAAVALNRTRDIEKLLKRDPDILRPGQRWGTLIIRASERAPGSVIETLIQAGASVDVRDDTKTSVDNTFGYTALHAAAFNGNKSAAAALIRHGANVRVREEKYHSTPAGWANYAGHAEVRDLILQEPVDLMEAVESGLTERVKAILRDDPGALDRPFSEYPLFPIYAEGWYTPLVLAVKQGQEEMVKLLVELGANKEVCAPGGRTLSDIAQSGGHEQMAAILTAPKL